MVTASDRFALNFSLSGGEKNDSPDGIKLLYFTPYFQNNKFLLMDRAYQGDNMRLTARNLGYEPIATDFISGFMTESFTSSEMRLKDFFADSNVSEEFLRVMISWIFYTLDSFYLL